MGKTGRPSREPTPAEREKVKDMVGVDAPIADIAAALKRSEPNLRKHFKTELFSRKKEGKKKPAKEPPFRVTEVMREKVVRYVGLKMPLEDVARVLRITEDELKEFFPEQLATAKADIRAQVLDNLVEQMEDGSIGATSRLEGLTAEVPPAPGKGASGGYVSKKAVAEAGAQAAASGGSKFAPPAPPKLIVNNS